jgi:hypothetical protein
MAFQTYGDIYKAADYFDSRLHEHAWTNAPATDRPKALLAATRLIDSLNFKGQKHTIHVIVVASGYEHLEDALEVGAVTMDEVQTASLAQELEFPRGDDTSVPTIIEYACYEAAHSLLDDKDPEIELENLGVISQKYGSVGTTYSRNQVPIEHLINLMPSALAWRWLKPFLRDEDAVKLRRIS